MKLGRCWRNADDSTYCCQDAADIIFRERLRFLAIRVIGGKVDLQCKKAYFKYSCGHENHILEMHLCSLVVNGADYEKISSPVRVNEYKAQIEGTEIQIRHVTYQSMAFGCWLLENATIIKSNWWTASKLSHFHELRVF